MQNKPAEETFFSLEVKFKEETAEVEEEEQEVASQPTASSENTKQQPSETQEPESEKIKTQEPEKKPVIKQKKKKVDANFDLEGMRQKNKQEVEEI